jgi:ATP-dependent helicase HrpB
MQPLPIDPVLPELCRALAQCPRVVLEAPPGAGKTTRVPRALLDAGIAGAGEVIVTEPRRLAARLAATRVANEHGERLGDVTGYRVRFEEVAGKSTRVVYVTEGVLLRRLLADPTLSGVGAVVLDEFHERHLETDLLLSLLARRARADARAPKLVVMSATLDAEPVARFLGDCPRVRSEGRLFPVAIEHLPEPDDRPLEKQVVSAVRRIFREGPPGDVLVFLPGAAEIQRCQRALEPLAIELCAELAQLHGDLPIEEQARAIQPAKRPKIVLSTNVAESSVTIEGVVAVVDSGLVRRAGHSPFSGLPTLSIAKISRASAAQRAGRAGRTREGRVLRLYTRGDFASRPEFDVPEIARSDLTESLLFLRGTNTPLDDLAWLTAPPPAALAAAAELLTALGASAGDTLTPIGRRLLDLPVHPRLGRILVEGERRGVAAEAALLVALLGERDIRLTERRPLGERRPRDLAAGPSDLLELCDAFELARSLGFDPGRLRAHDLDARSVSAVARAERQLVKVTRSRARADREEPLETALLICTLTGFVDRLARRKRPGSNELVLANGAGAKLSENSVVREGDLLVAVDVEERSGLGIGSQTSVRLASSVRAEWLLDLYSEQLSLTDELVWNEQNERVEQLSRMSFGAVVLEESRASAPSGPDAARVLARAAEKHGGLEFSKSDALGSLGERLALLAAHYPNAGLPALDAASALARAAEHATSFAELRKLDLAELVLAELTPEQRRLLDREAPERVILPNGRGAPIHYEPSRPPWLESRLQDFFGLGDGPRLCGGRVAVTLHLLAPNGRAVQVTSDLPGFWERHYPSIRRELMRRYPRHSWPEDGKSAAPTKR